MQQALPRMRKGGGSVKSTAFSALDSRLKDSTTTSTNIIINKDLTGHLALVRKRVYSSTGIIDNQLMILDSGGKISIDYEKSSSNSYLLPLILSGSWDEIQLSCEKVPSRAKEEIDVIIQGKRTRCLPIHIACVMNPTLSSLNALIEAYPASLSYQDSLYKSLPIHFACHFDASPKVVMTLYEANPTSISKQDRDGNLPLHLSCSNIVEEVTKFIFKYNEKGPFKSHFNHELKIQIIRSGCGNFSYNNNDCHLVLKFIAHKNNEITPLTYFTSTSTPTTTTEETIIHQVSLPVVQILLSIRPKSLYTKNKSGKTPLDLVQISSQQCVKDNNIFLTTKVVNEKVSPVQHVVENLLHYKNKHFNAHFVKIPNLRSKSVWKE